MNEEETKATEPSTEETNEESTNNAEQSKPTTEPEAKYTDADVDAIVKKRLGRELAKAEAEKQAAVDEAAKLAKMNADQKKDYELEKAQAEADALKKRLATFEMAKTARTMFDDEKLAVTEEDLQHVVTPEAASTEANVKWLIAHDQALAERVRNELLKGATPRVKGKPVQAKSLSELSYEERTELARQDPEAYQRLRTKN